MTPRLTARAIVTLIGIAICVVAVLAVVMALNARKEAQRARNDRDMAQGRTISAAEAITEIGALEQRGDASDAQVEEAHNAIRQADPADRGRVARHRLCQLQHRTDCDGLLGTGPADP